MIQGLQDMPGQCGVGAASGGLAGQFGAALGLGRPGQASIQRQDRTGGAGQGEQEWALDAGAGHGMSLTVMPMGTVPPWAANRR